MCDGSMQSTFTWGTAEHAVASTFVVAPAFAVLLSAAAAAAAAAATSSAHHSGPRHPSGLRVFNEQVTTPRIWRSLRKQTGVQIKTFQVIAANGDRGQEETRHTIIICCGFAMVPPARG